MKLAQADRRKLTGLLEALARSVEDLLLSGLTTASEATRQALDVSFQEASRLRLLRLGSVLRSASDELGRFTRNEPTFSGKRLAFFLNRAWLLSHALVRALRAGDERAFDRLLWAPASEPVERLEVVTLGIAKKVAAGAFVAFEFRLRALAAAGPVTAGHRLAWSCLFPLKPGLDLPAEAFLHLPQKQKFTATVLTERKTILFERAAVAIDEYGGGRVSLSDQSAVTVGEPFAAWGPFQTWDPGAALRRVEAQRVGPFDLDVEMQEEVVLKSWELGEPTERDDGQAVYPVACGPAEYEAVVSAGPEGKALRKALGALQKRKQRPPLFGLMHYSKARLVLQPLAVFGEDGPEYLTLSDEKIDRTALLKMIKF